MKWSWGWFFAVAFAAVLVYAWPALGVGDAIRKARAAKDEEA